MAAKFFALLTNQGAAKLSNMAALGEKLEITSLAVGDGGGISPTPNQAQTALVNEVRRAQLNSLSVDDKNASQIIAEQIIPESSGGWWIREIGLFDADGILIAVANCPETYKATTEEGSGRTQVIRMMLTVSSTDAVTLKVDPSVVLATRQYVDSAVIEVKTYTDNAMKKHVAAANPHSQYLLIENALKELAEAGLVGDVLKNLGLKSANGAYNIGMGDTTVGDILKQKIYIIAGSGQSNYAGANNGGPNPASDKVKVWDGVTGDWGSSDFTKNPFSRSNPHGNGGNNNIALAFAHRLVDEFKAEKVYIIHDAQGGRPIEDWTADGVNSVRYAAIKSKIEAAFKSPEIIATGKTDIDFLLFAQGEANALTDTVVSYRDKIATLDKQFRAENWMADTTPMFIMGMSGLHMRYQVWLAQLDYCENHNRNCIYVNSAGLKTQYDVDQTGDYTHWLGPSLWEHGYYRIWQALHERGVTHRQQLPPFYARGEGPWKGEADAIALFSSLVSIDSATEKFPLNAPAATGSISWGFKCSADGNYTLAGGYQVSTDNLASYSAGWGREIVFSSSASYCASFGYQNVLNQWAQFAAGRGHNLQHQHETALGRYSKYTTVQDNPVLFQLGCGLTGSAKNALTVRSDGTTEIFTGTRHDPAQEKEIVFEYLSDTKLKLKMLGTDGTVRSVTLTLS